MENEWIYIRNLLDQCHSSQHMPLTVLRTAHSRVEDYTRGIVHDTGRAPEVHCLLDPLLLCQSTSCSCLTPLHAVACVPHRLCCCCLMLSVPDGICGHVSSYVHAKHSPVNFVVNTPVCIDR